MKGPARTLIFAAAIVVAAALAQSAAAAQPWPGRTISYYNQASSWGWSVKQAVEGWNAAGLRIRFVRAPSPARAQVLISSRRLPSLPGGRVAGRATVGYLGGRRAEVHLARPDGSLERWAMARVAAHELGHVLGLGHTRASCALMIESGSATRWGGCPPQRRSQWRCRLLERDDIRRALRLYGGRAKRLREPPVCFRHARPAAPSDLRAELTATETPAGWSLSGRLAWRNPKSASFAGVKVGYRAGSCPSSPSHATPLLESADDSFVGDGSWERRRGTTSSTALALAGLAPGEYCFAVWSTDEAALRPSAGAATATVAVGPPPPPPAP